MTDQIAPPDELVAVWQSLVKECFEEYTQELVIELSGGPRLCMRVAPAQDEWLDSWKHFLSLQTVRKENYTLPESVVKFLEWAGNDFTPQHAHQMLALDGGLYFYCPPNRLFVKNDSYIYSIQWKTGIPSKKEVH